MKKVLFILFQLGTLVGQVSSFDLFDVIVYSEYYFDGIMAEVDGEVKVESLPLNFEMGVPANTDSVFFVSGSADSEAEVKHLSVLNTNNRSFIQVNVLEPKFRIFIFYPIEKNGANRSGEFNLEINHDIEDAHIILQEPLVAENFTFSEKDAETFQDQHGLNFKRIHLNNFRANTNKLVSFNYENPSNDISINTLQGMLSDNAPASALQPSQSKTPPPVRHRLPLWQPLVVLGVVAIVVGWMFHTQRKLENKGEMVTVQESSKGKFCTQCGTPIEAPQKFCANCGVQL